MTDILKYIVQNWELILTTVFIVTYCGYRIYEFIGFPTEKKKQEVLNRLFVWVVDAEKEFGAQTGKLKLSKVYDKFCLEFPSLKKWFSLEQFDSLVGQALDQMKKLFENNTAKENALKTTELTILK